MICSNTYQYNILTKATDLKEREARNIPHFSFFSNYYTSNGRVLSTNSPCNVADEEAVTRTRT